MLIMRIVCSCRLPHHLIVEQNTKIGLSGVMIQARAKRYAEEMGIKDFTASKGWLYRFISRYGLRPIRQHGEASW